MWITENWIPTAAVLGAVAVVLLFLWSVTQRGIHVVLAGACLLLIGAAYAVDVAFMTEPERVEQRTLDLTEAFRREDVDELMTFFPEDAEELRSTVIGATGLVDVGDDLRVTDVRTKVDGKTATIHFRANATINVIGFGDVGYKPSRWRLTWEREGESWVCSKAQRLDPVDGSEMQTLERRP